MPVPSQIALTFIDNLYESVSGVRSKVEFREQPPVSFDFFSRYFPSLESMATELGQNYGDSIKFIRSYLSQVCQDLEATQDQTAYVNGLAQVETQLIHYAQSIAGIMVTPADAAASEEE